MDKFSVVLNVSSDFIIAEKKYGRTYMELFCMSFIVVRPLSWSSSVYSLEVIAVNHVKSAIGYKCFGNTYALAGLVVFKYGCHYAGQSQR